MQLKSGQKTKKQVGRMEPPPDFKRAKEVSLDDECS